MLEMTDAERLSLALAISKAEADRAAPSPQSGPPPGQSVEVEHDHLPNGKNVEERTPISIQPCTNLYEVKRGTVLACCIRPSVLRVSGCFGGLP